MKPFSKSTKAFVIILFVLAFAIFNVTGQAQVFSSAAGNIIIPDGANAPLCTNPGAYVCKSIIVSGLPSSAILTSATVVLGDHENIGSLDMQVRAPGGSPTFFPFSRTGSVSPADCGDTTDAHGEYTFLNGGIGDWWATAAGLTSSDIMPAGTYFPSFPGGGPSPPAGTPNNTMSLTFLGVTNGTWDVCVRDWGDNIAGRLELARLTFAVPTAAIVSVTGQVVTAGGAGIRNASVIITGDNLPGPLTTSTGSFGYYSFSGIPVGGVYIITVKAKRFTFSQPSRVFNIQDSIADANFIAEEQ